MRFSLLLALGLVLAGCAQPTSTSSAQLSGYYKSSYGDGFSVSSSTFTQYDDNAKTVSFAGTIANNPDLGATAGTIIVQITDAGTWAKTVGHYYAIRWKGLTSSGAQESSASAYPTTTPDPTTLSDAVTAFAPDSLYGYYGEYAKQ